MTRLRFIRKFSREFKRRMPSFDALAASNNGVGLALNKSFISAGENRFLSCYKDRHFSFISQIISLLF